MGMDFLIEDPPVARIDSPPVAAAKVSISAATAYRFEHDHRFRQHSRHGLLFDFAWCEYRAAGREVG
jgi:hypothetical protein